MSDDKVRSGKIVLRVNASEMAVIEAAAKSVGLPTSGWVRMVSLAAAKAQESK